MEDQKILIEYVTGESFSRGFKTTIEVKDDFFMISFAEELRQIASAVEELVKTQNINFSEVYDSVKMEKPFSKKLEEEYKKLIDYYEKAIKSGDDLFNNSDEMADDIKKERQAMVDEWRKKNE
jgi:deoxyribodipyrimidine photolyase